MFRSVIAIAALATVATPTAAFATNTNDAINTCAEAIRAELPLDADAVKIDFDRISGSRVKTLSLEVKAEDVKGKVSCKVRRGDDTPTLAWDETLEAFRTELAQREGQTVTASAAP